MAIGVKIEDGRGTGKSAKVNGEGELSVVVHPHPPAEDTDITFPFRQFLTDDGTSTGSSDLRVNGSTTPQEFWVQADNEQNIYIKTVSFVISDSAATLSQFGALTALTNGCQIIWRTQQFGETIIAAELKTNFDFIRLCLGEPAFGDGATAFRANNISGNSEGYIPVLDFTKIFGLPWGLELREGTKDKLIIKINDNVSTVDAFNALAYGIKY